MNFWAIFIQFYISAIPDRRDGRHVESDFLVKAKRRVGRKSEALISAVGALVLPYIDTPSSALRFIGPPRNTKQSTATSDGVPWKEAKAAL